MVPIDVVGNTAEYKLGLFPGNMATLEFENDNTVNQAFAQDVRKWRCHLRVK